MNSKVHTLQDILDQTQVWAEAIHALLQQQPAIEQADLYKFDQVLFIGCGSTYYLSLSAATLLQSLTGLHCRGIPSSELFLSPSIYLPKGKKTALCAISRSGNTTETVRAVEAFEAHQAGKVLTITNNPESRLARMGDVQIVIPGGLEQSIAQTKSFSSMYVAVIALSHLLGGQKILPTAAESLIQAGDRILRESDSIVKQFGEDHRFNQVFFLGSGVLYGLACEASLKLKEMSLTISEPFHFLEFRHGPISMVDSKTLVVGLVSDGKRDQEMAVLDDVKRLGGNLLTLGEDQTMISFRSGLPEEMRSVLYLPPLQSMALYRALSFGLNPDKPRNLSAVVTLKLP